MDHGDEKKKVFKFFFSYQKELRWLEEMAAQGWLFANITFGVRYTFRRGVPKRMIYDIDRFSLSKKPSLEEIRRKEMFMEMAREMGWREAAHDEAQNYYFAREYEEGGINCLHNDEESRRYRAGKFRALALEHMKQYVFWMMVIAVVDFLLRLLQILFQKIGVDWFHWFSLVYVVLCSLLALFLWHNGEMCAKELALTREEWERSTDPATHKTVRKLILTSRGLNRFLSRQAAGGWTLTEVTALKYYFTKSGGARQVYTMDSKWLVNKRREAAGEEKIGDSKDYTGQNSDWEIQSVHDAEEKGWSFVCALENRSIIYRGDTGRVQPLNDGKYENRLRWISLVGEYGSVLLLCALFGAVIGFVSAMMIL